MTIVRTFHPVGEGAFYTEVFKNESNSCFVVVYDCGTTTRKEAMDKTLDEQIDDFKRSIGPNPKIDLLFISHFHSDHTSGLDRLLRGVKVDRTVIPMLDTATIMVTRVQNYLRYSRTAAQNADNIIRELYLNEEKTERFGEISIVSPVNNEESERSTGFCNGQ